MDIHPSTSAVAPSSGDVFDPKEEVYLETPIDAGFGLGQKWVLWEQYENTPNQ